MEITCPACRSRFTLKADKLPKVPFRVVCGKCRHPFTVDPATLGQNGTAAPQAQPAAAPAALAAAAPAAHPAPAPATAAAPAPAAAAPAVPPAAAPAASSSDDQPLAKPPVEEFQENLRLAMLCTDRPDYRQQLQTALQELGYKSHTPPGPKEALSWVFQNKYEIIMLDEEFGGGGPDNNEVLIGLNKMQIQVRRHLCVGLVGKGFRTMDNMVAYHKSVNFVMSDRDVGRAKGVIRTAVADNDEFYRVFKETMKALGKT